MEVDQIGCERMEWSEELEASLGQFFKDNKREIKISTLTKFLINFNQNSHVDSVKMIFIFILLL